MKKRLGRLIIIVFFVLLIMAILKKQPETLSFESAAFMDAEVEFLRDLTYSKDEKRILSQEIFEEVFNCIDHADDFIIVDMFLFNDNYGNKDEYVNLSQLLSDKLIEKKKENPQIKIVFITDAINTFYGSYENPYLEKMKEENIDVVITNLEPLANSNPLYSLFWDNGLKLIHRERKAGGWIANPFGDKDHKVYLSSYLKMLNFKANHRKTLVTEKSGMIISANPHGASYYHSNIGFLFRGKLLEDLVQTELNVIEMSNQKVFESIGELKIKSHSPQSEVKGKVITEEKIKINLIESINALNRGDELKIALFYLSEFDVIKAIKAADLRGVQVQIILDPNKDAFGIKKIGIPNVSVAKSLIKDSNIQLKWYDTKGEQFHSKIAIMNRIDDESIIIGGSANFTRRNLNNYNLETNLMVKALLSSAFSKEVNQYFDRIFNNKNGVYVADYSKYKDHSLVKEIIYFVQELTGLSTF